MGYYDGLGGVSDRDSTWDVACATNTPVILVVRPKGASLTIAAQVQGMLSFRKRNQLAGILLNAIIPGNDYQFGGEHSPDHEAIVFDE